MAQTFYTQDRVETLIVAISAITGKVYRMLGCQQFNVKKDDSGNAGTFAFSVIPVDPTVNFGRSDDAVAYAKECGPMDLIAIYARRASIKPGMHKEYGLPPIGPADNAPLSYGGDGGATVAALGSPRIPVSQSYDGNGDFVSYGSGKTIATTRTLGSVSSNSCIFVGMLDGFDVLQDVEGNMLSASFRGRDLTKIFYVNFSFVPVTAQGAGVVSVLSNFVLSKSTSGADLLRNVADLIVSKKISQSVIASANLSASTVSELSQYGYPWRDFINSTNRMSSAFRSFGSNGRFVPYQLQSGSAWANMQEIRNAPINRLFVDEWGNMVFDDQLGAWKSAPSVTIPPQEIMMLDPGFDDSTLITFLSSRSAGNLTARYNLGGVLGIQRNNTFVGGLASDGNGTTPAAIFSKYGYRYAELESYYDIDAAGAQQRRAVYVWMSNNIWRARAVVRGSNFYRVGDRVLMNLEGIRPEVDKQVWYITGIQHQFASNSKWEIMLDLAYPLSPDNSVVTSNVP